MRNKILALLLIVSVAFNIYLLTSMNQIKITVKNKTIEVDSLYTSIKEKEDKLLNIDTEFKNVQTQLNELAEQKEILDTDISNNKDKLIEVLGEDILEEQEKPQNVSSYAGTTSKHGYVYADDFNERGKRYEDRRGRLEQRFDQGMITEEQYQQSLKLLESTKDNGSGTPSMEDVVKAIDEATNPDPVDGSTTPGGGGAPIELPEGNTYHPDGILCY